MCTEGCIEFGRRNLTKQEVQDKRVIDVGSRDVNGSLRPVVESLDPAEYIGVDIVEGRGVDMICAAEDLVARFGDSSFDLVISTELMEHVEDWRLVISNLKNICKPGGTLLVTTRSYGFVKHDYDFWRYEPYDMKIIFSDCIIESLGVDSQSSPGVFVKARKPRDFVEMDLSNVKLYSMVMNERVRDVSITDIRVHVASTTKETCERELEVVRNEIREKDVRIEGLQGDVQRLNRDLNAIRGSLIFRLMHSVTDRTDSMLPEGTTGGTLRHLIVTSLQIAANEGPRSLIRHARHKVRFQGRRTHS